ncbi:hypothetical protein D3C87_1963170 [compost metagenome]
MKNVMKHANPAARKYGFQIHAFVFVLTMVLLVVINLLTGPPWWALWSLFGWGIGLLSHWWFAAGPAASRPD